MESSKGFGYEIGTVIGDVLGWVFLMSWRGATFVFGYIVIRYLGAPDFAQSGGLLSAMATIWAYEHRRSNERWERLFNR
jgi:hypothetical protein